MPKVCIDPGHGGQHSGAVQNGIVEKDMVLPLSIYLGRFLQMHGIEVVYTRTNDSTVSLEERAAIANRAGADFFLSVHADASPNSPATRGHHVIASLRRDNSKVFATSILSSLFSATGRKAHSLGVWTRPYTAGSQVDYYGVLRYTKMPANIVEVGFLTNPLDAALLKTNPALLKLALGLGLGILAAFNIPALARLNVDGEDYGLPLKIIDGVSYAPVRSTFEALGYNVGWSDAANAVTITSPKK